MSAWGYLMAAAAFIVGLGVGAGVLARRRSRLARVREGIAELARGNLAHRIIMPGESDIARMADDVNRLADAVQQEREAAAARDSAQRLLLANVSHDMRTPIASIAGYVDALQRGLGDDPDRYLAVIASKSEELAELTDDLFYQARLDSGDLELVHASLDLAEAVRRAVLGFEPQLAALGVQVAVDVPESACQVVADSSALTRVLNNLIANALKHGVRMRTFSVGIAEQDGRYLVRLSNDGATVPRDVDRLFERGVSGTSGGTGLGLAIARELAGRMGASVAFDMSDPGWATFSLSFPQGTARR